MTQWKLVPVEIDDDALFSDAVCEWINRHYAPQRAVMSRPMMKGAYRAMLAAAPDPTQDEVLVELVAKTLFQDQDVSWQELKLRDQDFYRTRAKAVLAVLY